MHNNIPGMDQPMTVPGGGGGSGSSQYNPQSFGKGSFGSSQKRGPGIQEQIAKGQQNFMSMQYGSGMYSLALNNYSVDFLIRSYDEPTTSTLLSG